ncbi:hypothetical protein WK66_29280 [Burkholderia ubonensis]|nr:hypothetical protein WK66_29280 [Burkholderia ubonensis]
MAASGVIRTRANGSDGGLSEAVRKLDEEFPHKREHVMIDQKSEPIPCKTVFVGYGFASGCSAQYWTSATVFQ